MPLVFLADGGNHVTDIPSKQKKGHLRWTTVKI